MSLKTLGILVSMLTAVFAIMAASAAAAIEDKITTDTTEKAVWSSGGTAFGITEATGKTPNCSAATNFVLKGIILSLPAELTATGVSCSGKLWNDVSSGTSMAVGKGTLSFSGITVNKPAGCKLNGEANGSAKLTTEKLTVDVQMTHSDVRLTEPEHVTAFTGDLVIAPAPVTTLKPVGEKSATIQLTGCAAEGNFKATGSVLGEAQNDTGVSAVNQKLVFNTMTNEINEGTSLVLAGSPATVTGTVNNEIGGAAFQVN
jgi:hypothetical protein